MSPGDREEEGEGVLLCVLARCETGSEGVRAKEG